MDRETHSRSLEHEVLLCCAAARNDEACRAQLARLSGRVSDWDGLLRLAESQGMLPLLRRSLDEIGATPASLTRACVANAAHNLGLTAELLRILSQLEAHDIAAVPFKGPALADQVFGNIAMRQFCDIDILVRPKDVARAKQVLQERGYRPEFTLDAGREAEYIRSEHAFQFHKEALVVELHWSFGSRDQSFPLSASGVWQRLQKRTLQGRAIDALSTEDLFLYLCMHGAKHSWERLEWICSLAELASTERVDWRALTQLAKRTGALRGLHLGLLLAQDICAVPLPPEAMAEAVHDRTAVRLAQDARDNLFAGHTVHHVREFRRHKYYFEARERLQDRARIVFYSCARIPHPLARDWELFRLPAGMSFLYYLLRPLRLFRDYGARLLQGKLSA